MKWIIRLAFVILLISNWQFSYGQFYYFKPNNDSCYCDDLKIIGIVKFDTLTDVIPPDSYRLFDKSRKFIKKHRLYRYCTGKTNTQNLIGKDVKEYLYSILENDVYITAQWPNIILRDFVKACTDDSLRYIIEYTLRQNNSYEIIGERYVNQNFYCVDYQNKDFLLIQINPYLYNRILIGYNICSPVFLLPELSKKKSKKTFVKILLPILISD